MLGFERQETIANLQFIHGFCCCLFCFLLKKAKFGAHTFYTGLVGQYVSVTLYVILVQHSSVSFRRKLLPHRAPG